MNNLHSRGSVKSLCVEPKTVIEQPWLFGIFANEKLKDWTNQNRASLLFLLTICPFMVPCMVVISWILFPMVITCPFNLSSALGTITTACGVIWMVAAISPIHMQGSCNNFSMSGTTVWPVLILTLHSTVEFLLPPLLLLELRNWNSDKQGWVSIAHNTNSTPSPLLVSTWMFICSLCPW